MAEENGVLSATIEANPKDFTFPLNKTLVLVSKMQREFLDVGGFGSLLGNDVALMNGVRMATKALIAGARAAGVEVIHTKEAHKPDLSDVSYTKKKRTFIQSGSLYTIGDMLDLGRILIDGEPGNAIVDECAPLPGEKVFLSSGKGLYMSGIHEYCMERGITHILMSGVTTEIGVQLVMRELNDRGFQPCLVQECTGSYFPEFRSISFEMITAQMGIIGWTATLAATLKALASPVLQKPEPRPAWLPPAVPVILPPDTWSPPPDKPFPLPSGPDEVWATIPTANPTPFSFPVARTAVITIDMQRDFILEGGFGSTLGNNVKLLQAIMPSVALLLKAGRENGLTMIHTLEAHKPDLSDCPLVKLTRSSLPEGLRIGDKGEMGRILVRNEWGNGIVDENAPLPGEKTVFKPGKASFFGTDLHPFLVEKDISHLLFAGVTTEVCVQTTMREANDRGYECLIVTDCTESYFPSFHKSTLEILTAQGGIVGWSATVSEVQAALQSASKPTANGMAEG